MLSILLALAAPTISTKMPPAQALPPPTGDEQAVLAPVNALLAAFDRGDSAAVLRLVYSDGRVTATGTRGLSGSGLRQQSWAEFVTRIKPDATFQETIGEPAIEVDGDAAMVWAPYVVRVGGKIMNCGFDHFDLVRDNGAWRVMNLTFSSRIVGCPAQ
jgi:ketosteroid isomerase-like protein